MPAKPSDYRGEEAPGTGPSKHADSTNGGAMNSDSFDYGDDGFESDGMSASRGLVEAVHAAETGSTATVAAADGMNTADEIPQQSTHPGDELEAGCHGEAAARVEGSTDEVSSPTEKRSPDGRSRSQSCDDALNGSPREQELDVDGAGDKSTPHSHGDRCLTRRKATGGGFGRAAGQRGPRGARQDFSARERTSSGRLGVHAASAARMDRERQEHLIEQLAHDNKILKRKIAGFQLALQLSSDEDTLCATPSFSAAFSAAPPAFPREGGPPSPSPRVERGWAHQKPPARRSPSVERDLSYTSLVRQLNAGERRTRAMERANEALGARVNALESGAVLKATQATLAARDEEIQALREELSVMCRLARAQDRKFDGSEGYAMARRLWVAEEELRRTRSKAASMAAELSRLRGRGGRRGQTSSPRVASPSNDESRTSPCRSKVRRRSSNQAAEDLDNSEHVADEAGSDGRVTNQDPASPSRVGGWETDARGRGAGDFSSVQRGERDAARDALEAKVHTLQRALASMRGKARGEVRAARAEIDSVLAEKALLERALDTKAKEVRMQLLQVNRLKRELRDLSDGTAKLEEATGVCQSPTLSLRSRGLASAAAGTSSLDSELGAAVSKRRTRSAAAAHGSSALAAPLQIAAPPASSYDNGRDAPAETRDVVPLVAAVSQTLDEAQGTTHGRNNALVSGSGPRRTSTAVAEAAAAARSGGKHAPGDSPERAAPAPITCAVPEPAPGFPMGPAGACLGVVTGPRAEAIAAGEKASVDTEPKWSAPVKRASRRPCPLSGLLDMSEMPLPQYRRSFYSSELESHPLAAATAASSATMTGGPSVAEVLPEDAFTECVLDLNGCVRHAKDCVLQGVSQPGRFTLNLGKDLASEPRLLRASTTHVPVQQWSAKDGPARAFEAETCEIHQGDDLFSAYQVAKGQAL